MELDLSASSLGATAHQFLFMAALADLAGDVAVRDFYIERTEAMVRYSWTVLRTRFEHDRVA